MCVTEFNRTSQIFEMRQTTPLTFMSRLPKRSLVRSMRNQCGIQAITVD